MVAERRSGRRSRPRGLTVSLSTLSRMDAPYAFKHSLDPDLFALDRLDQLFRRAPAGKAFVQLADEGRERPPGFEPTMTELQGSLADDLAARRLHVHLHDLPEWAPEYARGARTGARGRRHRPLASPATAR